MSMVIGMIIVSLISLLLGYTIGRSDGYIAGQNDMYEKVKRNLF